MTSHPLFDYAYLCMWLTVASFAGTSVVLSKMPETRRKIRIGHRMSHVTVFLGVATLTLFICALTYV
jgi:hypothetical protein